MENPADSLPQPTRQLDEQLRDIRIRLRRSMNGVVSSAMREKGLHYKLNFGVTIPQLKEMAKSLPMDALLAQRLWREEVREMNILATLLHPADCFPPEQALTWLLEAPTQEIREQLTMNLFPRLPFAMELAEAWQAEQLSELRISAFLLYGRLFIARRLPTESQTLLFLQAAGAALERGEEALSQAVLFALKRYGYCSEAHALRLLSALSDYETEESPMKQAVYEALKFEFQGN